MSAQLMIECMKKLVQLHQVFINLADEKTEALTKGDNLRLRSLLQKESAQLKQLEQLEQERSRLVRFFISGKGLVTEGGTLAELLPYFDDGEKGELVTLQKKLIEDIEQLKKKNELNQQLIQDALRFVNLSLDMLQPELDTGNYGRVNKEDEEPLGRSLFDSKA